MNSILRIYVPSTLNVTAQHTEVLTVTLNLTLDISLMSLVIESVWHNHFSKELLKYIFMKLDFINI